MVSTVSMSSTISTWPANKFLLTVHLLKVPPRALCISMHDAQHKKLPNTALNFFRYP